MFIGRYPGLSPDRMFVVCFGAHPCHERATNTRMHPLRWYAPVSPSKVGTEPVGLFSDGSLKTLLSRMQEHRHSDSKRNSGRSLSPAGRRSPDKRDDSGVGDGCVVVCFTFDIRRAPCACRERASRRLGSPGCEHVKMAVGTGRDNPAVVAYTVGVRRR
jgi:hypothetical protein